MKKQIITAIMATLLCFIGFSANQGAFAKEPVQIAQAYSFSYMPQIGEKVSGAMYVGQQLDLMSVSDAEVRGRFTGAAYGNTYADGAKEYFQDTKNGVRCQARRIEWTRRYIHLYLKGDKHRFGLPELQYGANMPIAYEVQTATRHICHLERYTRLWVFRNASGGFYALKKGGIVEPFRGTPVFDYRY